MAQGGEVVTEPFQRAGTGVLGPALALAVSLYTAGDIGGHLEDTGKA